MRKRKGVQKILTYVALSLVALLVLLEFAQIGGGKGAEIMQTITNFPLSGCQNIGNVDIVGFMQSIDRVYHACDDDKRCEKESCERMTLTTDINVTGAVLNAYGQPQFFNFARPSIACNVGCGSGSPTIYAMYPTSYSTAELVNSCRGRWNSVAVNNFCAQPDDSYFSFKQGKTVDVSALHVEGFWFFTPTYTYMKVQQKS